MISQPSNALPEINGASGLVPRRVVHPWPMQPRKNFHLEYLDELAGSIEQHGILNDLICRPRPGHPGELEIIGGECRWRAAEMAGIANVPVKVRELSDGDALELALVDNMKRRDLSPLEECDAFAAALEQTQEDGSPRYASVGKFEEKIGVAEGYVRQRLRLRKLDADGRAALERGEISFDLARTICAKPEAIIPAIVDVVLNPSKHDVWVNGEGYVKGPLATDIAQQMIATRFVRDLRAAPFKLEDANLLPVSVAGEERKEGGACIDCPWNSVNRPAEDGDRMAGRWCFNPACYSRKIEIHTAGEVCRAQSAGQRVLQGEEAAKIINADGTLRATANYVKLDEKPDFNDRNQTVPEKNLPKWEKLVKGEAEPPVIVAIDKNGGAHRLVERNLAVAAAQLNKMAHFLSLSAGAGNSLQESEHRAQRAAELREKKLKSEVALAAMAEVIARIDTAGEREFWAWMVEIGMALGGNDAQDFVHRRRDLSFAATAEEGIRLEMKGMAPAALRELAVELLIARAVKFNGISDELFRALAKACGVDLNAIDRAIRAEAKPEKKKAAKAEPPAPDDPPPPTRRKTKDEGLLARARELRASGQGGSVAALQTALRISYQAARRLMVELATEEGGAK